MANERTLEEALDLFDAWEAAAQEGRSASTDRTLRQVIADLERSTKMRLRLRRRRASADRRKNRSQPAV